MPDREKVIKSIKACANNPDHDCESCEYRSGALWCYNDQLIEDFLALLKDQPEIVRCKDCKHKVDTLDDYDDYEGKCPCYCSDDPFYSWVPDDDWFCADGERKEE